jgi:peptidoglycan hydrolase-like protein with peptidoglycan-binding domain
MAKFTGNIQYGATGDNVKKIQEALNSSGNYNLTVDGVWGDKTDAAIKDYQKNNGLSVDGIVGEKTWGSLFGSSKIETPSFEYADFQHPNYTESDSVIESGKNKTDAENALNSLGDYTMSDDVIEAGQKKTDAENAVGNYGDFAYGKQDLYDDIINKIMNREKFSYDLNGDALYQQYKDKYIQQGKTAMQDTMGQAAAMTGGYGNSYAATAGNQAYQASLEKLNDVIPELYQMAYDKYRQEGQDMYNQYAMLSDDRSQEYGMWSDGYNRLLSEREYYANNYNNAYGMDYGQYVDKYNRLAADRGYYADVYDSERNFDYGKYSDDRNFEYGKYADDKSYAYQDHRNQIADEQWQAQFDEAVRMNDLTEEQWKWQKEQAGKTSGSSGGSGGSGGGTGGGSDFKKATFSREDDNGNYVFYIDGKERTYAKGVNPYTGTTNKDTKNGTFSNGYQPNNVGGQKLSKSGITDVVNGVTQNVWQTPDGKLWIWDGTQNKYFEYEE